MKMELKEIKKMRLALGLTQKSLAQHSGLSQSLIAKIESGKLDPSYSNAQKILKALDSLKSKGSIKAAEIMNKKIIFAKPDYTIKRTAGIMKKHSISQLPVIENNVLVGIITEKKIVEALVSGSSANETIAAFVGHAPITIGPDTPLDAITSMLSFAQMLVVLERGKIKGIITNSDVIEHVSKK